jgi:hypothetical protein
MENSIQNRFLLFGMSQSACCGPRSAIRQQSPPARMQSVSCKSLQLSALRLVTWPIIIPKTSMTQPSRYPRAYYYPRVPGDSRGRGGGSGDKVARVPRGNMKLYIWEAPSQGCFTDSLAKNSDYNRMTPLERLKLDLVYASHVAARLQHSLGSLEVNTGSKLGLNHFLEGSDSNC